MAHEIEENNAFFVGQPAWHKLGTVIEQAPTIEEGIRLAGLDWKVEMQDLVTKEGIETTSRAVIRETDKSVLGVVGPNWEPMQNIEAFNFFNEFLDQGVCNLEAAGSLKKGKNIWVLAKINNGEREVVKNDPINPYILLSNGHDGKTALRAGFTPVRTVCWNTMTAAHESGDSSLIRIFHSGKMMDNLELVKSTMDVASRTFNATLDKLEKLQHSSINQDDIKKFVNVLYFNSENILKFPEAKIKRFNKTMDLITQLVEEGMGSDIPGVKGTKYGLYQASNEYLNHHKKSTNDETRMSGMWFGNSKTVDSASLDYLLAGA